MSDHFAFLIYTSGSNRTAQRRHSESHEICFTIALLYCNGLHICSDDRVALLYSCKREPGFEDHACYVTQRRGAPPIQRTTKGSGRFSLVAQPGGNHSIYFRYPSSFVNLPAPSPDKSSVHASSYHSIGIGRGDTKRTRRIPKALFCRHHSGYQIGDDRDRHLTKNVLQRGDTS